MMKSRLWTSAILLLIGFALGFLTSFLIFNYTKIPPAKVSVVQKAKVRNKQADSIDASYQRQIDTLTDQNIELQQEIEVSQGLLQQLKQEVQEKENKINRIISPGKPFKGNDLFKDAFPSNNLLYTQTAGKFHLPEKEGFFTPMKVESGPCLCDSLKKEVLNYIDANHRKDSVYELQLLQFDSLLAGKDLVIETSGKAYSDLKLLLDVSISSQAALQKENLLLQRQSKRQRFKSKVLTGGLMILSGFAASFILRH
jgi:hypothetical protein